MKTVEKLNELLASITVLSRKVQNYHWNVEGRQFFSIHAELEKMYDGYDEVVDTIAERILALGYRPLTSLKESVELSKIKEGKSEAVNSESIIKSLQSDYNVLIGQLIEVKESADEENDYGTSAIVDEYIIEYQKLAWMLRAYLA